MNPARFASAVLLALAIAGCSAALQQPATPTQNFGVATQLGNTGAGKIKHVIYIVQEGRSFDTLFQGYPGADTVSDGNLEDGKKVPLQPVSLGETFTLPDLAWNMFKDCNGTGNLPGKDCRMNGFSTESSGSQHGIEYPAYVYVNHADTKPYFAMAHQWVVADRMFASQLDGEFVAHQYIIAAQAHRAVDAPNGYWGCANRNDIIQTLTDKRTDSSFEKACFGYATLGSELNKAQLSWRFYTSRLGGAGSGEGGYWSSYASVREVYGSQQWTEHIVTPQKRFFSDIAQGKLANFTWITPICVNSDYAGCGGGYGPSWVAALVNAVGQSKFWDSTAIFVQWDTWGGFYDHVGPKDKDFDSLGFRVPLLVISPYAKHDFVAHAPYETASVLRFAEDLYGLDTMAAADRRARSPAADCFDFLQQPRAFVKIPAPYGKKFFEHQRT